MCPLYFCVFVLSLLFAGFQGGKCYLLQNTFLRGPLCSTTNTTGNNCTKEVGTERSKIDCAVRCLSQENCTGFKFYSRGRCYLHNICDPLKSCVFADVSETYVRKQLKLVCSNGGTWDDILKKCKCKGGWIGEQCDRQAGSCRELADFNYQIGMVHWVTLDIYKNQSYLIENVGCYLSNTKTDGTNTIVAGSDGRESHNKSYTEFVDGYFVKDNFWVGLESLFRLNRLGYDFLKFQITFRINDVEEHYHYQYKGFHINGATENYTFTIARSPTFSQDPWYKNNSLVMKDCLSSFQGIPFSAWDMDRDYDNNVNCAAKLGSGWWIGNCSDPRGYLYPCHIYGLRYPGNPKPYTWSHLSIADIDMTNATLLKYYRKMRMFFVN